MSDENFLDRLGRLVNEVDVSMNCIVYIGQDVGFYDLEGAANGRHYLQIRCWRKDVITGEMGWGHGGKAYLSEHATDNELVQTIFGLYKSYWEHEARETFKWRGRRVFGPHISTEALWTVANQVDVRSAQHAEDKK